MTIDPKFGFSDREWSLDDRSAKYQVWAGRIAYVDAETMTAWVFLDTGIGRYIDVKLTAPGGSGVRAWSGMVPEAGTKVLIGWTSRGRRNFEPIILDYMTAGIYPGRDYEKVSSADPEALKQHISMFPEDRYKDEFHWAPIRLKSRKVYSGDFLASSAKGSDFLLDEDVLLTNRSGVEVRLRDADSTVTTNAVNEFVSNSAGKYFRGLIRRSQSNISIEQLGNNAPELEIPYDFANSDRYGTSIPGDSPAFEELRRAALVDENGDRAMSPEEDWFFYPPVVQSDGKRVSYITSVDADEPFSNSPEAYTEDRKELRHKGNDTLEVTSEIDGFDIDPLDAKPQVYIEDVHGTVVGNDCYTDSGKSMYRRLIKLEVLNNHDFSVYGRPEFTLYLKNPVAPTPSPIMKAFDPASESNYYDNRALARLYRVVSPDDPNNQYLFAVSKEGKVYCHIPAATTAGGDEAGQSADFNIQGLVRAVLGSDANLMSLDLHTQGGIRVNAGKGPVEKSLIANLLGDAIIDIGSQSSHNNSGLAINVSGDHDLTVRGASTLYAKSGMDLISGGQLNSEASGISFNADIGGIKITTLAGSYNVNALSSKQSYADTCEITYATNHSKTHIAGKDSTVVRAGSIERTVTSGLGINDKVTTGSYTNTVGTGDTTFKVASGSFSASVASGPMSLSAVAGLLSMSGSTVKISSPTSITLAAPAVNIGSVPVGHVVRGTIPDVLPALDYITGLPLRGSPTVRSA
jgi:hypothetical protein